ncbi:MAG: RluA family pseudouridine synthase [Thermoguttaceae bacterium]|nr:RluA family pseudouridine synthase [Thermoguttaceae bacterium]
MIKTLYEDNHLLVLIKPAGIPTMGVEAGRPSFLEQARQYVKEKYNKPGNVYLGVVSRLDTPTSGVMVFARTSKGAERLNAQFRNRTVNKVYWALAQGNPQTDGAHWEDFIVHDSRHRKVNPVSSDNPDAIDCRLSFTRLKQFPGYFWAEIHLETGRKHQIRLQFSQRGFPLLGDYKYGSRQKFPDGIALHCRSITFEHPTTKEVMTFTAPVPNCWKKFGVE